MIIEFPNGVHDANLFLDFQGTAELSVTVASVQLQRIFILIDKCIKRWADIYRQFDIFTWLFP